MTAVQEKAIDDKIISNLARMDAKQKIILLKITMGLILDDDFEDLLFYESDLEAIKEGEKEFAAGEGIVMEI